MPRAGVTYQQVEHVAVEQSAKGQQPSTQSVRDSLGTGSYSTISKHLRAWRDAQPRLVQQSPPVSEKFLKTLQAELDSLCAAALMATKDELAKQREENALLIAEGEQNNKEIDVLENEVLTLKRDATAISTKLETLQGNLREARASIAALEVEKAELNSQVTHATATVEHLRTFVDENRSLRTRLEEALTRAAEMSGRLEVLGARQSTQTNRKPTIKQKNLKDTTSK